MSRQKEKYPLECQGVFFDEIASMSEDAMKYLMEKLPARPPRKFVGDCQYTGGKVFEVDGMVLVETPRRENHWSANLVHDKKSV